MKKIVPIALIFCLTVPFLGTYTFIRYQKKLARREIKRLMIEGLKDEQLTLLSFSVEETKHQLSWKHDKEFQYQGEMYDIVKKEIRGDSIFYVCWWDHKETVLNKQLDQLVKINAGTSPHQEKQERALIFLRNLYCTTPFSWNIHHSSQSNIVFPSYTSTLYFFYSNPILLPPETAWNYCNNSMLSI